jgi:hypothetical protein
VDFGLGSFPVGGVELILIWFRRLPLIKVFIHNPRDQAIDPEISTSDEPF